MIETTLRELYKFGPGPSSSHTMGPMLAGHDFYKLMQNLDPALLAQAKRLKIVLLGSLSATGKGHGTDRAVVAGVLGQVPAHCPPEFLDQLASDRYRPYPLEIGPFRTQLAVDDVVYGATVGHFHHPNTLRLSLEGEGPTPILEREYYSVGGGFIEWKGYQPPPKPTPPYPYSNCRELMSHVTPQRDLYQVLLANEMALTGQTEEQVLAFVQDVISVMRNAAHHGLERSGLLPGSLQLQSKAQRLFKNYQDEGGPFADRALSAVTALAIAVSEENARGHVICTAPTAGSAGVMAGTVHALASRHRRNLRRLREGIVVGAAIGYLCKNNATISGAEGGCQAEMGVAAAMTAALFVHYRGGSARSIENAAESALEQHLGLTCDPVGGYVQIPCIERNAFGLIKAWTASIISPDNLSSSHKVDLDSCIEAMRLTAAAMSSKYKETSRGGLAQVLC